MPVPDTLIEQVDVAKGDVDFQEYATRGELARDAADEAARRAALAADVTGLASFYDTLAAAQADVGNRADGDVVEVLGDESLPGAPRARYVVAAGALSGRVAFGPVRVDTLAEARTVAAELHLGAQVIDLHGPMTVENDRGPDVDGGRVVAVGAVQLVRQVSSTERSDPDWYLPGDGDNPTAIEEPDKAVRRAAVFARYPQLQSESLQAALLQQDDRTSWGGDGVLDFAPMSDDTLALLAALNSPLSPDTQLNRVYETTWGVQAFGTQRIFTTGDHLVRRMGSTGTFPANVALEFRDEYGPITTGVPFVEERRHGTPDHLPIREFGTDTTGFFLRVAAATSPAEMVGLNTKSRVGQNPKDSNEVWRPLESEVLSVSSAEAWNGENTYKLYMRTPVDVDVPVQEVAVTNVAANGDGTSTVTLADPLEFALKVDDPYLERGGGNQPALNTTTLYFHRSGGGVTLADFWDVVGDPDPRQVGVPMTDQNRTSPIGATQLVVNNGRLLADGSASAVAVGDVLTIGRSVGGVFNLLSTPDVHVEGGLTLTQDDETAAMGNLLTLFDGRSFSCTGTIHGLVCSRLFGHTRFRQVSYDALEIGRQLPRSAQGGTIGNPVGTDAQTTDLTTFRSIRVKECNDVPIDIEGPNGVVIGDLVDVTYSDTADFPRSGGINGSIEAGAARIKQMRVSGGTPDQDGVIPISIFGTGDEVGAGREIDLEIGTMIYEGPYDAMRTDYPTKRIVYRNPFSGIERVYDQRKRHVIKANLAGQTVRLGFGGVPRRISVWADSASDRAGFQALLDGDHVHARLIRRAGAGAVTWDDEIELGRELAITAGNGFGVLAYTIPAATTRFSDEFEVQFYLKGSAPNDFPDDAVVVYDVEYWTNAELLAQEDPADEDSPILFSHRLFSAAADAAPSGGGEPSDTASGVYVFDSSNPPPSSTAQGNRGLPADLAAGEHYALYFPLDELDATPTGVKQYVAQCNVQGVDGIVDRNLDIRCRPVDANAPGNPTGENAIMVEVWNQDPAGSNVLQVGQLTFTVFWTRRA